jgi:hypothetical protein
VKEDERYLCDGCNADITETSNSAWNRLQLRNQGMIPARGLVTDVSPILHVARDHHFCNLRCLKAWAEKA